MGVNSAELFLNLGLCCFYCQQFDLSISCIERARSVSTDDVAADIWYNIGNIYLVTFCLLNEYIPLLFYDWP